MSSDSESDARLGKAKGHKQASRLKKKNVNDESSDADDESEDSEQRRGRKEAERRLQKTLKKLHEEKLKKQQEENEKKKAMVMDIDSESLSSKEHIVPQVTTHRSNMMVRQNIDDLESESEDEPPVKPTKKDEKVEALADKQVFAMSKRKTNVRHDDNHHSKENKEVSRVARRQNDDGTLSDESAVIRYKQRQKEREKNNMVKKVNNDTDNESDRKPSSKPVLEESNHRRSPRIKKKKVIKMKDVSDSVSEHEDDDESVNPESIGEEVNSEDNDEDSFDSESGTNFEYDDDNCIPALIPYFNEGNVWDWTHYVSTVPGAREPKIISKDEFPQKGSIKVMSVRKYMIRRGWDVKNKKQQQLAKQKIGLTLKNCKHTVKCWLNRFLVDFAPYCNILCRDMVSRRTRAPRNLPELHDAMSQYERIEDLYNVFNLLYFSFDKMKNYAKRIADAVMDENSIRIDPSELAIDRKFRRDEFKRTGKKQREKLNCVQKLISVTLNEVRKPFRKLLKDKYNIEFTLKRQKDNINSKNVRKIRMPGHLYDWMISGDFKSPVRETVLSKQYLIKLVNFEELNNIKEILKAETSIQKAQAYIYELQENVVRARNVLSRDPDIIDLMDEKSEASVKPNKRRMPSRSSKDKAQNYVGDKSESENENDLIPYKIPRKNELKEIKIEKMDDKVAEDKHKTKTKRQSPTRQAVVDLLNSVEKDENSEEDDNQKKGTDEEETKRAKKKEAKEQLLKIQAARDEVRKLREMNKNEASEDDSVDDDVIDVKRLAFLKKRADEEALVKEKLSNRASVENETEEKDQADQQLKDDVIDKVESIVILEKDQGKKRGVDRSLGNPYDTTRNVNQSSDITDEEKKLAREANLSQTVLRLHLQPGVNTPSKEKQAALTCYALSDVITKETRQEDDNTITSKDRVELRRFYNENIINSAPFVRGTELLDKMSDRQHKLFLNLMLERFNISAERSLALNLHKKKKVITEELLAILHNYIAEDEGGDLSLLSLEEKIKLSQRVAEKVWDIQVSVYENPLSPVRDIIIKTTKELKDALVSDRVPAQHKTEISHLLDNNDYNNVRNRALFPTENESKVEAKTETNDVKAASDDNEDPRQDAKATSDDDEEPTQDVKAAMDDDEEPTQDVKAASDDDEEPTQEELNKDRLYLAFMAEDERKRQLTTDGPVAEVVMETPIINKPSKKVSNRELNSIKISKEYGQETHAILDPNSTRKRKGNSENEDETVEPDKKKSSRNHNSEHDSQQTKKKKKEVVKDVYEIKPLKNPTSIQGEGKEELVTIMNLSKCQGWKPELLVLDKRLGKGTKPYYAIITGCFDAFPNVTNKYLEHRNLIDHDSRYKWRNIGYKLDPLCKKNIGTHQFDEFTDIPKFLKLIQKHSK